MAVRARTWQILQVAKPGDILSQVFDIFLVVLIVLNIVAVVAGAIPRVNDHFANVLGIFAAFSVAIFTVEYLLRLWSCTADPRFARPVVGRLKLAAQPLSILDLAAFLPYYLPFIGFDLRFVRALRLMQILRAVVLGPDSYWKRHKGSGVGQAGR